MLTPVMSPGSRSGVNWMRLAEPATLCAIARASEVLPVPGKSSSSRWPSLKSATKPRRTTKVLPSSTCSTPATRRPKASWKAVACSGVMVIGFVLCCADRVRKRRGSELTPCVLSRVGGSVGGDGDHQVGEVQCRAARRAPRTGWASRRVVVGAAGDADAAVAGAGGQRAPGPVAGRSRTARCRRSRPTAGRRASSCSRARRAGTPATSPGCRASPRGRTCRP